MLYASSFYNYVSASGKVRGYSNTRDIVSVEYIDVNDDVITYPKEIARFFNFVDSHYVVLVQYESYIICY